MLAIPSMAKPEPNIPETILRSVQKLSPLLSKFFPQGSLKMGGGTILQSRWNHRVSTDAELFAVPESYYEVIDEHRERLERKMYAIKGVDQRRSWVETVALYCFIDGTEVTLMPDESFIRESSGYVVPETQIETETSASILGKKVLHRMLRNEGAFEVRDVFDIHTAISKEPAALDRVLARISESDLIQISRLLKLLPKNWLTDSIKPLIGVHPLPKQLDLIVDLSDFLEEKARSRTGELQE